MSVTRELLDALKAFENGASDYRIAKIIGVGQSMMTNYNDGSSKLSVDKVIFICETIGLDKHEWLMRLQMERAKSTAEKEAWNDLLTRMAA